VEYRVEFRPEAEKDLSRLDKEISQRILKRIKWLAQHFEEITVESLTGRQWKGLFKLRVGDYRVLYTANRLKKLITIHLIGHRREIYE
jgi:mRNA interferase RelE/StbE